VERDVAAFWMHQYALTNEMYEAFDPHRREMRWWGGTHPLAGEAGREGEDWCPVVNVSFYDAWCFAKWVGDFKHNGMTFEVVLPSELQWEHACRAGSKDAYWFGNDETALPDHAWFDKNNQRSTHPVGLKRENKNGLFDMHGNVWEWCASRYAPGALFRVLRGGGWYDPGWRCRSAYRSWNEPAVRSHRAGFRLAAVPAVGAEPGRRG
jgi:formylglycine-generating enzyme required for sulfatase activity